MPTPHPRHVTHEQFANGCTIDGSRLDRALEDILERWNNVKGSDVASRWMQTQFVQGFTPDIIAPQTNTFPFLAVRNEAAQLVSGDADEDVTNYWRVKGWQKWDNPYWVNDREEHWTTTMWFERPTVLTHVAIYQLIDSANGINRVLTGSLTGQRMFAYTIWSPSEFDKEDASMASVLWQHTWRDLDNWRVSETLWSPGAGTWTDMSPAAPIDDLEGAAIEQDLYILIPARSRVKFTITAPDHPTAKQWIDRNWSATLTALEPIDV